ncbi:MAG: DUF4197 domain-containing protein [Bacteroidetes bacterium]|nr:DUF4197 domain-containing protein [Bacteroidota bacterium]
MKKCTFLLCCALAVSSLHAQGLLNKLKKATSKDSSGNILKTISSGKSSLSNDDIVNGLKEALSIGTDSAAGRLHKVDGFFANAALKILMPPEAQKVEATLRKAGLGSLADKAILSMNRAAEDAAGSIAPIFIDAIKHMTLTDGLKILNGGNNAATEYLKGQTTAALTAKMKPIIEASLSKVNATQYWKDAFTAYNKIPFTKAPVNTDLTAYVTDKALNGVFLSIADEEKKIRTNPAAQVTSLLKKVFGK